MSQVDPSAMRQWSNDPNAPKIPYALYIDEKAAFAGTLIGSILYGIVVTLFFKCMAALLNPVYLRGGDIKWGLVSYTAVMFSFVTVFTTMNLNIQSTSFIDNREFQIAVGMNRTVLNGPLMYQYGSCRGVVGLNLGLMSLLNYWLADGFLLYRCYVIYGKNFWVIVLPCLMYLSSFATGILLLIPYVERPFGCVLWSDSFKTYGLIHYSISSSLNILLTLMIVIRLVLHTRNIRTGMGVPGIGGLCKAIITMLIESSVIYATSSFLVFGSWDAENGLSSSFLLILTETQVIAPLLIILRVANKTALTSNTVVAGRVSTFKARARGESADGGGTLLSGDSTSSVDEIGMNSCELPVEFETGIESHPEEI